MKYDNYIVSFIPGARGRLIANILYKLANNESTPITFTEHNSAHNSIEDWNMIYVSEANQILPMPHLKSVFFTHLYPTWEISSNTGVVIINVPEYKLPEVCLNATIKNTVAKVEFMRDGGVLDDRQMAFLKTYEKLYPKNVLPDNYLNLLDDNNLHEFFVSVVKLLVPYISNNFSKFIKNDSLVGDNILNVDYDKMFDKENGKYVFLKQLTSWLELDYNSDIHNIYEQYDLDKFNIFEKYCPWFEITEK
jgi:hypothetical protein